MTYLNRPIGGYSNTFIIADLINHAMRPFKLGDAKIWVELDISNAHTDVVRITSDLFPEHPFKYELDVRRMAVLYNPESVYVEIGEQAGEFFRSIYVEPPSNVYLGEN